MYKNTLTHWFSVGTSEGGVEERSTKKKNKNQFHVVGQSRNASFVLTIVVHVLKYFISKSTRKVTFLSASSSCSRFYIFVFLFFFFFRDLVKFALFYTFSPYFIRFRLISNVFIDFQNS